MEKIFAFDFLPPPKFVQSEIKVMLHCSVVVTPRLFLDFSLNISLFFQCHPSISNAKMATHFTRMKNGREVASIQSSHRISMRIHFENCGGI